MLHLYVCVCVRSILMDTVAMVSFLDTCSYRHALDSLIDPYHSLQQQ